MNTALAYCRGRYDSIQNRGKDSFRTGIDPKRCQNRSPPAFSAIKKRVPTRRIASSRCLFQSAGETATVVSRDTFHSLSKGRWRRSGGRAELYLVLLSVPREVPRAYLTDKLTPLRTGGKSGRCLAYTSCISRPLEGHGLLVAGLRLPFCPWKDCWRCFWWWRRRLVFLGIKTVSSSNIVSQLSVTQRVYSNSANLLTS